MNSATTAIGAMLAGLVDYAGIYPPASLDMRSAVESYHRYRNGKYQDVLGRFIVDFSRIDELRATAGSHPDLKLSVILARPELVDELLHLLGKGLPIESVECKASSSGDVERLTRNLPKAIDAFVEIPFEPIDPELLRAIFIQGAQVKLRMGGVVAEAFPSVAAVSRMAAALSEAQLSFKATAGLHHPFRSLHPFTYAHDSPSGLMHGFINLLCAVSLLHFGGNIAQAERVLEEQDPDAWRLSADALEWRTHSWPAELLSKARENFISFGSCSFEEPIHDLEALGWL